MLAAVFLAVEEFGAEPVVGGVGLGARACARDGLGLERPSVEAKEAFGGRGEERRPGARCHQRVVAARRRRLQPTQQRGRVDGLFEQKARPPGQHHLAEVAGREGAEGPPQHPVPLGAGGVVAAHVRERQRARHVGTGRANGCQRLARHARRLAGHQVDGQRRGFPIRPKLDTWQHQTDGTERGPLLPHLGGAVEADRGREACVRRKRRHHVPEAVEVVQRWPIQHRGGADARPGLGLRPAAPVVGRGGGLSGDPEERVHRVDGRRHAEHMIPLPVADGPVELLSEEGGGRGGRGERGERGERSKGHERWGTTLEGGGTGSPPGWFQKIVKAWPLHQLRAPRPARRGTVRPPRLSIS